MAVTGERHEVNPVSQNEAALQFGMFAITEMTGKFVESGEN